LFEKIRRGSQKPSKTLRYYIGREIAYQKYIFQEMGTIMLISKARLVMREYFTVDAMAGTRASLSS
jgi:hypothetical protein